jgi:hypothetical protein
MSKKQESSQRYPSPKLISEALEATKNGKLMEFLQADDKPQEKETPGRKSMTEDLSGVKLLPLRLRSLWQ